MFDYSAHPELLKGRIILVTGAARGIGAAAAKAYAAHGATVLLLGRTEASLAQVHHEIKAAGQPQPLVIPFDLQSADPAQYHALATMIERTVGRLDGLLHNASIIGPRTSVEHLPGEDFMEVMHVNVNATFMLYPGTAAAASAFGGCIDSLHLQQRGSAKGAHNGALTACRSLPPKA